MRRLFVSLLAAATVSACRGALTPGDADAVGTLLSVSPVSQFGEYRLHVYNLSVRPENTGAYEIYLLVTNSTPIYITESGHRRRASVVDLRNGARILALVGDIVLDSNPAQYGATRIEAEQERPSHPD